MNKSKVATWDDLADAYHKRTGQSARIQPMNVIYYWATAQTDLFTVMPDADGTLVEKEKAK